MDRVVVSHLAGEILKVLEACGFSAFPLHLIEERVKGTHNWYSREQVEQAVKELVTKGLAVQWSPCMTDEHGNAQRVPCLRLTSVPGQGPVYLEKTIFIDHTPSYFQWIQWVGSIGLIAVAAWLAFLGGKYLPLVGLVVPALVIFRILIKRSRRVYIYQWNHTTQG